MGDIPLGRHSKIIHPVNGGKCRDKFNALYIYHGLHTDLPQLNAHLLQGACYSVCERSPQYGNIKNSPFLSQTEKGHFLLNINHTEQAAQPFAQNCSRRAARHTAFQDDHEKQIQHNVKKGTDNQKIQRHSAVPQCPQCIGEKVVNKGKDQSHEHNPQIHSRRVHNIRRNLQKIQQRTGEENQQQGNGS